MNQTTHEEKLLTFAQLAKELGTTQYMLNRIKKDMPKITFSGSTHRYRISSVKKYLDQLETKGEQD